MAGRKCAIVEHNTTYASPVNTTVCFATAPYPQLLSFPQAYAANDDELGTIHHHEATLACGFRPASDCNRIPTWRMLSTLRSFLEEFGSHPLRNSTSCMKVAISPREFPRAPIATSCSLEGVLVPSLRLMLEPRYVPDLTALCCPQLYQCLLLHPNQLRISSCRRDACPQMTHI
jgi:hypothetical protein